MEQLPIEVLRRIPPLLPSSGDVSRLMRSGPRQLYTIGGEFLYSNIRLTMGATRPTRYASSVVGRVHGRRMLELLSSQEPRHALDHPAGWIRHLVVVWPLFANDEEEGQRLLLRALSLADGLLSLELQGVSPPAWNNLLHDSAGSSLFLPRLEALKTDSMQDSICLAEFRQLESVYVTSWSSSAELQDLILALNSRNTQSTMKQLQLSLKIDGLEDVNATLSHISTAFPDLSVLCVEFDLGLEFPERPLSWSRIHVSHSAHFSGSSCPCSSLLCFEDHLGRSRRGAKCIASLTHFLHDNFSRARARCPGEHQGAGAAQRALLYTAPYGAPMAQEGWGQV